MDNSSGPLGERYAAKYLQDKGFEIVACNYHSRYGEIDIIARNSHFLVFVEVKTREKNSLVSPLEAVTAAKKRKIIKTAMRYLQSVPTKLQPRFDVIGVIMKDGKAVSVQYIENAFGCEGFC